MIHCATGKRRINEADQNRTTQNARWITSPFRALQCGARFASFSVSVWGAAGVRSASRAKNAKSRKENKQRKEKIERKRNH